MFLRGINTWQNMPASLMIRLSLYLQQLTQNFISLKKKKRAKKFVSDGVARLLHMETKMKALIRLKEKYGERIYFKIIGDGNYINDGLDVKGLPWRRETELEDMKEFDIGIMPLPDTEWAKGKCGLKGLQYMALGIPTIMSPVGVNSEIIEDGVNGMLAMSDDEWVEKISMMIESDNLRKKLADAGRKTVEEKYSVVANRHLYLEYFNQVLN